MELNICYCGTINNDADCINHGAICINHGAIQIKEVLNLLYAVGSGWDQVVGFPMIHSCALLPWGLPLLDDMVNIYKII